MNKKSVTEHISIKMSKFIVSYNIYHFEYIITSNAGSKQYVSFRYFCKSFNLMNLNQFISLKKRITEKFINSNEM
jgi:hypothetical protein